MTGIWHAVLSRLRGTALDVCMGTFFSAEMARRLISPDVPWLISTLITCAVYIIYVLDHIVDSREAKQNSEPHKFEWIVQAQYPLGLSLVVVLGLAINILRYVYTPEFLLFGIMIGLLVAGYYLLGIMYKKGKITRYPKEWIIALVFTGGIWGYYLLAGTDPTLLQFIFPLSYFTCMLFNVYLFAYFEKSEDQNVHHFNVANHLKDEKLKRHLTGIAAAGTVLNIFSVLLDPLTGLILLLMTSYLFFIYLNRDISIIRYNYGIITDAVLLFPLLYVLF